MKRVLFILVASIALFSCGKETEKEELITNNQEPKDTTSKETWVQWAFSADLDYKDWEEKGNAYYQYIDIPVNDNTGLPHDSITKTWLTNYQGYHYELPCTIRDSYDYSLQKTETQFVLKLETISPVNETGAGVKFSAHIFYKL